MGRPTKFTAQIRKDLYRYVERGLTYASAARLAGVHPDTFRKWRRRGEKAKSGLFFAFHADLTRAQERLKLAVHTAVLKATAEGDWRAGMQLLACRFPDEYSEKRILKHEGAVGVSGPQEIDPSKLSPEKQALLYALLDEAQGSVDVAA